MNPYILEISEEERQIYSDLLAAERKSLETILTSPFLTNKERQEISNRLTVISGMEYNLSETPLVIG